LLFNIKLPLWLMNDGFTAKSLLAEAAKSADKMKALLSQYSDISMPSIAGHNFAINLPALLIVWVITLILVKGIKEAASTNPFIVVLKLVVVVFIIIAGANYINTANWHPFIPERTMIINPGETIPHGAYGLMGILGGAGYIFFAYIGFDTVSTQAGEAKNPQKDVPFGIITSLIVCTILYILVSLVLTGMINYKDIDITAPIAAAFGAKGLGFAVLIISIAAIAGLTSVLIVMLLGQSRVFYAMAKDGLLPKGLFGTLHSKFHTPYKASILTGFVVSLVSAFTPISVIAELVNIGTLLAFVLVCGAVWIMRVKEPDRPRPFRTPWLPVVATLGILCNLAIMLGLEAINWIRLVVWLLIGFVIYFTYSR